MMPGNGQGTVSWPPTWAVCAHPSSDKRLQQRARQISEQLHMPIVAPLADGELMLVVTPRRLVVHWQEPTVQMKSSRRRSGTYHGRPFFADLSRVNTSSPPGRSLRQQIARAVGITKGNKYRPRVIDATAGFGQDAWLLASLGCRVTAIERHPVMALLLKDALQLAAEARPDVATNIKLLNDDARAVLAQFDPPDVIYLDPMFPPRRRGAGAAEPKRMRLLRRLVGEDHDASELFSISRQLAKRRVVVKRPLHTDPFAEQQVVAVHKGKSVRYDVYSKAVE